MKYLIFILLSLFYIHCNGQLISGTIRNKATNEGIAGVNIIYLISGKKGYIQTDSSGGYSITFKKTGVVTISTSHVLYQIKDTLINVIEANNYSVNLAMEPTGNTLQEVYLTAREKKGLTTSSVIDKQAMRHIQPSSLTDIMELLPGGRSRDPMLTSANLLRIRETGIAGGDYDIGTLGTAFMIDGVPLNVSANLQYAAGLPLNGAQQINTVAKGVDMRTISTDNIEQVEVVRGITSAEHGNLTNGLVKIIRKKSATPWESRLKADGFSTLFYAGKGFRINKRNITINTGLDLLDARSDPRLPMENYRRYTATFRLNKIWENSNRKIEWDNSIDYTGSFDNKKNDMDDPSREVNSYLSSNNRTALNTSLFWEKKKPAFFRSASLTSSVSLQQDKIEQRKWVQAESAQIIATHTTTGEHTVGFLTPNYLSYLKVDGKPQTIYLKLVSNFAYNGWLRSRFKLGGEWNYSKNNGRGQLFNPNLPPSPGMTLRNRRYKDIPAASDIGLFAEAEFNKTYQQFDFRLNTGFRFSKLLNLPATYTLNKAINIDPRLNFQISLPSVYLGSKALTSAITLSYGMQSIYPVLHQLFPEYQYRDMVQFNYYHDNPAYRTANVYTYRFLPVNEQLKTARNQKWEARLDLSYDLADFSLTFFKENMHSGFRNVTRYQSFSYKRYSAAGLDPNTIIAPPAVSDLPYEMTSALLGYSRVENGSSIIKQGIEYHLSSKRVNFLNSRFTVYGAWFYSYYENSVPLYRSPSSPIIIDGKRQEYIGLYQEDDGYKRQSFNTNFVIDNYMPKLGLIFSTSFQALWWTANQNAERQGRPIAYIDPQGNEHPYTAADASHYILQWLERKYDPQTFRKYKVPLNLSVNFKASKSIKDKLIVSLFVNRMISYIPDYYSNNVLIRRSGFNTPYFGMELNFKL